MWAASPSFSKFEGRKHQSSVNDRCKRNKSYAFKTKLTSVNVVLGATYFLQNTVSTCIQGEACEKVITFLQPFSILENQITQTRDEQRCVQFHT